MNKIKKVLILGSGALKIGEAGEFDYSGSQAVKAFKEEGIYTILLNPNIATIQTSDFLADRVYFLPVTSYFAEQIIKKEQPDGILMTFGGQTALNCGLELHKKGILRENNVSVMGTPISAILLSEDRKKFANHLIKNSINTPLSLTATNLREAVHFAHKIGFPVMLRSGFSLGGQGSGIAKNEKELRKICLHAFSFVKQILVEKYLHHFKEVEYEVVRDKYDNCITVCNMENMDPLGIHTGESIVIAPSQTLTNYEYHKLRAIAIKIVRSLKIIGECNVQFALNPNPIIDNDTSKQPLDYYVIELNARLSRSSALASKATGYPLAYIAAKLALGKSLYEIENKVTKSTTCCFEPALDYVTVKIPRWDLEKFRKAENTIGSSMKSVGEVMSIGRTYEEAYQKAIRMLDLNFDGAVNDELFINKKLNKKVIRQLLKTPTPKRIFVISKAIQMGISLFEINKLTGIDLWFLYGLKKITDAEKKLKSSKNKSLTASFLLNLKQLGFSDIRIAKLIKSDELSVRRKRKDLGVLPFVFQIDTLAGEFPAKTNYLYLTYNGFHHDIKAFGKESVIVLGSGPYRIGSSVEFDWTCVSTVLALRRFNKSSIVINCNPETVSTDYDISDKLYFEELSFERIADIYDFENSYGIVLSVGGQTPNNRAKNLYEYGARILGTHSENIDRAEDRNKFSTLLDELRIEQPSWDTFSSLKSAMGFALKVGFPVLVRPSYVLSGSSMRICFNESDLCEYTKEAAFISRKHPVIVSKFITDAKELEVDCVARNGVLKAFIVSEHIENAGVHSGDASILLPAQKVYIETIRRLKLISQKISHALQITGPFNIQCLAKDNDISVIEVNLRSSRTFPFISKVTRRNLIDIATEAYFSEGQNEVLLNSLDFDFVAVKAAQFSFSRLTGADPILGVEMGSTGEVACFGDDAEEAFLKAELSVGGIIPKKGIFISLGGEENKAAFYECISYLKKLSIPVFATDKTSQFLFRCGIFNKRLFKIHENLKPNILEFFYKGRIDFAINITDHSRKRETGDYYTIRRSAVDHNIMLFTNYKKVELFLKAVTTKSLTDLKVKAWDEYYNENKSLTLKQH